MTTRVPKIIKKWVESIALRNPQKQTRLYSKNAVLLATFEPMLVGNKAILGYMKEFLDKDNLECKITRNVTQIDRDRDTKIASGLYTFSFIKNGVKQKIVHARYTFVVNSGRIINHHSSIVPEE